MQLPACMQPSRIDIDTNIAPSHVSNPSSTIIADLCGCMDSDIEKLPEDSPIIYDMLNDRLELKALTLSNWPAPVTMGNMSYAEVVAIAASAKKEMEDAVHPKPSTGGAGTCTEGLPDKARQPCCPGCSQTLTEKKCETSDHFNCSCNALPVQWLR